MLAGHCRHLTFKLNKLQATVSFIASPFRVVQVFRGLNSAYPKNLPLHPPTRSLKYTHDHERKFVVTRPGSFGSSRTESE